ncbi:MAG: endonuclease [Subtercola sp.]|nr:endonuclease [Subtercola sp.]
MESGGFRAAAPGGLADDVLVACAVAVERLLRCAEALAVEMAGELAERSKPERGDDRLTVKHGCTDVVSLISNLTGVSKRTAATRVKLGRAVQSTLSAVGISNESNFPAVQAALRAGRLGVDTAQVITRMLGDSAKRVGYSADLAECERMLVIAADDTADQGLGLSADQVAIMAAQWQSHLDPDGAEPTARELEEKRGLWLRQQADGTFKVGGLLTAVQGAKWQAIAQTILSPRLPRFTGDPGHPEHSGLACQAGQAGHPADGDHSNQAGHPADGDHSNQAGHLADGDHSGYDEYSGHDSASESDLGPHFVDDDTEISAVLADTRTREQLLADGFTTYIDRVAALPGIPELCGARPTINIHATLDDVVSGRGIGWIDGLDQPVPVSTVEQLLCQGDIITTLMHQGRILQHGKTKRLFTAAQNRAMAARDGGCVWPGCVRPPSWCESHHTVEWRDEGYLPGRTDTDLGVLVCPFHHRHLHHSRWKLIMINGVPHIIPPPEIDPTQTPRPCTRRRTGPAHAQAGARGGAR